MGLYGETGKIPHRAVNSGQPPVDECYSNVLVLSQHHLIQLADINRPSHIFL